MCLSQFPLKQFRNSLCLKHKFPATLATPKEAPTELGPSTSRICLFVSELPATTTIKNQPPLEPSPMLITHVNRLGRLRVLSPPEKSIQEGLDSVMSSLLTEVRDQLCINCTDSSLSTQCNAKGPWLAVIFVISSS